MHRVVPVKDHEDSREVRQAYRSDWKRWLGNPSFIFVDAAKWNVGPAMVRGGLCVPARVDGRHDRVAQRCARLAEREGVWAELDGLAPHRFRPSLRY